MQSVELLHSHEFVHFSPSGGENKTRQKGTVVLIGGRAREESLEAVVRYLPNNKTLTIATIASEEQEDENYAYYSDFFNTRGIPTTHLGSKMLESISDFGISSETSGIFYSGGNQERIMKLMKQGDYKKLHEFYNNGGFIGGTSAGASVMGEIMPVGQKHTQGLRIVPYIIDQHVQRLDRQGRAERLVEQYPDLVGVKIDENTAWIYNNGQMNVEGEGSVSLIIASKEDNTINSTLLEHVVMRDGESYDLSQFENQKEFGFK